MVRTHAGDSVAVVRPRFLDWPKLATFVFLMLSLAGCVVNTEGAAPLPFDHERTLERDVAVRPGTRIEVHNLAGHVRVGASDGDALELVAQVRAGGSEQDEAQRLAESIELQLEERADRTVLTVLYPVEEYDSYHYSNSESHSRSGWRFLFTQSSTTLKYGGRRVRVSTRRRGGSASVHADLELRVPSAVSLALFNAVGRVEVDGVSAGLRLQVHSGQVETSGTTGYLTIDTGSGSVQAEGHRGDLVIDTGSGAVEVRDVEGEVSVDTGSGSVHLADIDGAYASVDTGSGSVELERVRGSLDIRTGSGSIQGVGLVSGDRLVCETGSGRVRLSADLGLVREVDIATSSGDVVLRVSRFPAMSLRLQTGSGDIDVQLPDLRVERTGRDMLVGTVGEGEFADVVIDTGSGSITLLSAER